MARRILHLAALQPTRDLTSIHLGILKRKQSTGSCRKRASVQRRLPRATPTEDLPILPRPWPPIQMHTARPTSRRTPRPTRHTLSLRHCRTCLTRFKIAPRATTRLHRPLLPLRRTRTTRPPSAQTQRIPRGLGGRRRVEPVMLANERT